MNSVMALSMFNFFYRIYRIIAIQSSFVILIPYVLSHDVSTSLPMAISCTAASYAAIYYVFVPEYSQSH
jgi:hypothetical protein